MSDRPALTIALDAQLSVGTATGIGEYVRGLAEALRTLCIDVVELREPRLDPWRFDRRVAWDQLVLPLRAARSGAALLHCASGTMPLRPPLPAVVTVHDVAWLRAQRHAPAYARWYFGAFSLHRYRRAAAVVVDSQFSRRELLDLTGLQQDRVTVVYPGVAADMCEVVRRPEGRGEVAVVGTVERRKNLEVLIRALPLESRITLTCVGPSTPYRAECEALATELGVRERVRFAGYVPRQELLRLYARCELAAVPSRYEGFGYAAAQALCAGVPVIVSDCASLPEIAGTSALIVRSDDPRAWAAAIGTMLHDRAGANDAAAALRSQSVERFSWSSSASAMLALYRRALA